MAGRAAAADLAQHIERLFGLLVRYRGEMSGGEESSMTPTQRLALATVVDSGPLRLGALAEALGTSDATATRTVDALAARGLVERLADDADRRAVQIGPTASGRRLLAQRRRRLARMLGELLAGVREEEQLRFVSLFEELNAVLAGRVAH